MTAHSGPVSADDAPSRRHEALLAAAVAVLDAAPDHRTRTPELRALARAVRDCGPGPRLVSVDVMELADPAKHVLSVRRGGEPGEDGPITLTRHARELERELDNDRPGWRAGPGRRVRNVVVSEVRAVVIASLLEELAARLVPGPAFGAGTDGAELARLVGGLAAELLDQAFA